MVKLPFLKKKAQQEEELRAAVLPEGEALQPEEQPEEEGKEEKPEEGKGKKQERYSVWMYVLRFLIKLAVIAAATWLLLHYVFGIFILRGNYMFPAVRDGDLCITYRLEDYAVNEVVLYKHDGQMRIGRIIALPGSTVEVNEEGELLVNGAIPPEQIFYLTEQGNGKYPYTVGDDELFIMNDFRSDAGDSREFGPISKADLAGKFIFIIRRRGF